MGIQVALEKFQRRGNVTLQSVISRDPMSVFWGGAALEALKIDIHRLDSAPCEGLFNFFDDFGGIEK